MTQVGMQMNLQALRNDYCINTVFCNFNAVVTTFVSLAKLDNGSKQIMENFCSPQKKNHMNTSVTEANISGGKLTFLFRFKHFMCNVANSELNLQL